MDVYLHVGHSERGDVDALGPFEYVQLTYSMVRVPDPKVDGDSIAVGHYDCAVGLWRIQHPDGVVRSWTDLTVSTQHA